MGDGKDSAASKCFLQQKYFKVKKFILWQLYLYLCLISITDSYWRFDCGQYMLPGSRYIAAIVIVDIRISSFLSLPDFYLYCALDGVVRFYVH